MRRHEALLDVLETRFEKNAHRHKGVAWAAVQARIEKSPDTLRSLDEMERTGGEPDVVGHDKKTGEYIFYDCSAESPEGPPESLLRPRSAGVEKRKQAEGQRDRHGCSHGHRAPDRGAISRAAAARRVRPEDVELGEDACRRSRKLGGALFCDRRYDTVFLYHNGAQSYYAARGFRGALRV